MKKIGISLRVEVIEKYNEKRDAISHDWINFLEKLEYTPILIPNKLKNVDRYMAELKLDGVILSGGDNIGEFPERDKTEISILKYAIENSIPVLGVCRGMQIINTFFEGNVSKNSSTNHVNNSHDITIINSRFNDLIGNNKFQVNSFHNNLIKEQDIGNELEIFALSEKDMSVEGYFHKKHQILGVMWHPERDQTNNQSKIMDIIYNKKMW